MSQLLVSLEIFSSCEEEEEEEEEEEGKQSVFRRIPATRPELARSHQEASCSCLDRVQSVIPCRVHHGGARRAQKARLRAPKRGSHPPPSWKSPMQQWW